MRFDRGLRLGGVLAAAALTVLGARPSHAAYMDIVDTRSAINYGATNTCGDYYTWSFNGGAGVEPVNTCFGGTPISGTQPLSQTLTFTVTPSGSFSPINDYFVQGTTVVGEFQLTYTGSESSGSYIDFIGQGLSPTIPGGATEINVPVGGVTVNFGDGPGYSFEGQVTVDRAAPVPEPMTLSILAGGLVMLGAARRRAG